MSTTPSAPAARPSVLKYLYTHNPFYAMSTVLMLFSIRTAYGTLEVGGIDSWLMLGVLAGYTLVLAVIGVLIVRLGKVWEDARSVLLLLLLLFLAVSISADDLFSTIETAEPGAALLLFGYLFSAGVSEAVLWGAGVRLRLLYRIPYHLMLALFYLAPWWYTPELHPRPRVDQEWAIFMFPIVAAGLFLCLMPAVRAGARYVEQNGTPWKWPWFPWTAFGVIATAVALRSYTVSMVYGLNGDIWRELPTGRAIEFNTIWGLYFLVPLAFAILMLVLEAAFVRDNRQLLSRVLRWAPWLLLLSIPTGTSAVFEGFLGRLIERVGSPVWLTLWLLIGFYGWARIRGAVGAGYGFVAGVALLSVVGPATISSGTLTDPTPWPFLALAALLLGRGLFVQSSRICATAAMAGTIFLWLILPQTALAEYRITTSYHALWAAILVVGLSFRDPFAQFLRGLAAAMVPMAALTVVPVAAVVPYITFATGTCLAIGLFWMNRWFVYSSAVNAVLLICIGLGSLLRRAIDIWGWPAVVAFSSSVVMLILGFLISAHKARWLQRLLPWRGNGTG